MLIIMNQDNTLMNNVQFNENCILHEGLQKSYVEKKSKEMLPLASSELACNLQEIIYRIQTSK
jgi:hypothetical protein